MKTNKLGTEWNCFNLVRSFCEKTLRQHHTYWEMAGCLLSNIRCKEQKSAFTTSIQHFTTQGGNKMQKNRRHSDWEEVKISPFTDDMILY